MGIDEERLTLTIPEVAKLLRIGRNTAYEAARTGAMPGVLHFGRTIRVSKYALNQFLSGQGNDRKGDDIVQQVHRQEKTLTG